jgi:hypothetical protein
MSAIATGREAGWPAPPSWLRCVGAVLVGTLLATVALMLVAAALGPLNVVPANHGPDTDGPGESTTLGASPPMSARCWPSGTSSRSGPACS